MEICLVVEVATKNLIAIAIEDKDVDVIDA
jgi:hypothetical protein